MAYCCEFIKGEADSTGKHSPQWLSDLDPLFFCSATERKVDWWIQQ